MKQTRRQFLGVTGSTVALLTAPGFISLSSLRQVGSSDTLTPLALSGEADIQSFGEGNPSFVLSYDGDEIEDPAGDLESWADEKTDAFRVVREYEHVDAIAVSVPWEVAGRESMWGLQRLGGGFDNLEYIDFADANARLSVPEPIRPDDLESESAFEIDVGIQDRVALLTSVGSASTTPNTDGLAFDGDAPEATLREARQVSGAPDTLLSGYDTSNARVCVIDTGVNDARRYDGDDGESRIHPQSTDFTGSGADETVGEDGVGAVEARDASAHGDWVSACILANDSDDSYSGFAKNAELVAAKSLDDDGGGEIADIVAGVELAIDTDCDVICMSLGSPQWAEILADVLAEAWDAGIFLVAATGNDRYATTFVASPAASAEAIGINATNVPESGSREDVQVSYFGNVGPHPGTQDLSDGASADAKPELAAPGMNVRIEGIGTLTGTSMAAPMVAGAATVLSSEGYGNEQILERLTEYAYPLANAGVTEAEHGLLDLEAALEGIEHEDDQESVRTDAARARDDFNRALSASRGGLLSGLF